MASLSPIACASEVQKGALSEAEVHDIKANGLLDLIYEGRTQKRTWQAAMDDIDTHAHLAHTHGLGIFESELLRFKA